MNQPLVPPISSLDQFKGHAALSHWALIRVSGADAARFLHGQLSNDVLSLDQRAVRLAGFCSAKGRLQASFWVWRTAEDELWLACAADLAESVCKRLQMFVMRAKCQLSLCTRAITGIWGAHAAQLADREALQHVSIDGDLQLLRLPDVCGVARAVLVGPESSSGLPPDASALAPWRWLEVHSGIPMSC
jgi:tRNA-modifying protein YgfZ